MIQAGTPFPGCGCVPEVAVNTNLDYCHECLLALGVGKEDIFILESPQEFSGERVERAQERLHRKLNPTDPGHEQSKLF